MSDPTYEKRTDQEYTVGVWDMTFYKIDVETNEPLQNKDGTTKVFYSKNIDAGYWASGLDPDDLIEMEEQDDWAVTASTASTTIVSLLWE